MVGAAIKAIFMPTAKNTFNLIQNLPGQQYIDNLIMRTPILNTIGQAAATIFTMPLCGGCGGALWAAYYTYQATGSMNAAYRTGAITFVVTMVSVVGNGVAGDLFTPYSVGHFAAHAAVGCAASSIGGGSCKSGALAGMAGLAGTPYGLEGAIIAGGVGSVIGGGKFVNGAVTGAFGYLFNHCRHNKCWGNDAPYSAPLVPPGVDVDNNIKEAAAANFGLKSSSWFYDKVRSWGPWDYKRLGDQYQDFGNFNYGATGAAFGFSEDTLLRMAGWAQVQAGTSQSGWGVAANRFQAYFGFGGAAPFGDDPRDQEMIKRGIQYYRAMQGSVK